MILGRSHQHEDDARAAALVYRSWSLWHLGFPDQAIDTMASAKERGHGNTTDFAPGGVITSVFMRRVPEVVAAGRRALLVCDGLAIERALEIARPQGSKSIELRAASGLALLWRDQDKVGDARELLAPVYGWFTDGFGTPDVMEVKALLNQFA